MVNIPIRQGKRAYRLSVDVLSFLYPLSRSVYKYTMYVCIDHISTEPAEEDGRGAAVGRCAPSLLDAEPGTVPLKEEH